MMVVGTGGKECIERSVQLGMIESGEGVRVSNDTIISLCAFHSSESSESPTLCDFVDYSPLGCSVSRISQSRIVERVAILFSRRSS